MLIQIVLYFRNA